MLKKLIIAASIVIILLMTLIILASYNKDVMHGLLETVGMRQDYIGVKTVVQKQSYAFAHAIINYHYEFGEYPKGSNAEISQALLGKNPDQKAVISIPYHYINKEGEFMNPWGTPYEIHISPKEPPPNVEIKIVSAGSNKIFGDEDDFVFERKYPKAPR